MCTAMMSIQESKIHGRGPPQSAKTHMTRSTYTCQEITENIATGDATRELALFRIDLFKAMRVQPSA